MHIVAQLLHIEHIELSNEKSDFKSILTDGPDSEMPSGRLSAVLTVGANQPRAFARRPRLEVEGKGPRAEAD